MAYKCATCGEEYFEPIKATGHNMSDWVVTKEATVQSAGEMESYCTNPGCGHKEKQVIPKLEPEPEPDPPEDPGEDPGDDPGDDPGKDPGDGDPGGAADGD